MTESTDCDNQLGSRVDANDLQAVRARVAAYLRVATRTAEDRDELLSEAMAEACLRIDAATSAGAAMELALAAARRTAKQWKRRQRREVRMDRFDAPAKCTFANVAYREALWEYEEQLLRQLPESQRAALELHEMDGLSDRVIAERLGCSPRSLPELRRRAKRKCRSMLRSGLLPPPPTPEDSGQ